MFYTRSNGMRVPATVVGFAPDGLLHLEYFQDAVKVVNRQCKVESISFAKFVAKGTHRNAPRVTFTCVEVAWMSILAILMFPSSP